jgi:hypothetical protein
MSGSEVDSASEDEGGEHNGSSEEYGAGSDEDADRKYEDAMES